MWFGKYNNKYMDIKCKYISLIFYGYFCFLNDFRLAHPENHPYVNLGIKFVIIKCHSNQVTNHHGLQIQISHSFCGVKRR